MTMREAVQLELYLLEIFVQFVPIFFVAVTVFGACLFGLWRLARYTWHKSCLLAQLA